MELLKNNTVLCSTFHNSIVRALVVSPLLQHMKQHEAKFFNKAVINHEVMNMPCIHFSVYRDPDVSTGEVEVSMYMEYTYSDENNTRFDDLGNELIIVKPIVEVLFSSVSMKTIETLCDQTSFYKFVCEEVSKLFSILDPYKDGFEVIYRTKEELDIAANREREMQEKSRAREEQIKLHNLVVNNSKHMRVNTLKIITIFLTEAIPEGMHEVTVEGRTYLLTHTLKYGSTLKRLA